MATAAPPPGAQPPGAARLSGATPVTRVTPPVVDEDSAFYWAGLRAHRLLLQRCEDVECRRVRFPPMPGCPWCGGVGSSIVESSGRGVVYSQVRVHRAFSDAFAADVPYVVATVELDDGCRVVGRVEPEERSAIGAAVEAFHHDHGEWTELRFRVVAGVAGVAGVAPASAASAASAASQASAEPVGAGDGGTGA